MTAHKFTQDSTATDATCERCDRHAIGTPSVSSFEHITNYRCWDGPPMGAVSIEQVFASAIRDSIEYNRITR